MEHQTFGFAEMISREGAALSLAWPHLFVAGAMLYTGGVKKTSKELVRGLQLYTQLYNFEGTLAALFRS